MTGGNEDGLTPQEYIEQQKRVIKVLRATCIEFWLRSLDATEIESDRRQVIQEVDAIIQAAREGK